MLICTVLFTVMQVCIKALGTYPTFEIVFFRSFLTWILCIFYLKWQGLSLVGNNKWPLVWRSVLGIIGMSSFFYTLQTIPLGSAVTIKYLSPVFTAVFAVLFINEKVKGLQWIYFLLAFLGIVMMKGFDIRIDNFSFWIGIFGAAAGGAVYIMIRKIGLSEHPLIIIHYYMLMASIVGLVFAIPVWIWPSPFEWLLLAGIGVSGYTAQLYMTKAFQIEKASVIAPMKYLEAIYALLIGFLWFGESYHVLSIVGICLVLFGMLMNVRAGRA